MSGDAICQVLEWDSEFFGKRIARATVCTLTENSVVEIEEWCADRGIDCLYFRASSTDAETTRLAHEKNFRLVDVRMTFEREVDSSDLVWAVGSKIRKAEESDIPTLRKIARWGHRDTRFYCDGNFPVERCDALYETWIDKSFRGWAKQVLVATEGGSVQGYLACDLPQPHCGQIGLVGVAEEARGRGLGAAMVSAGLRWFAAQGARTVSVVTQGRNIAGQRLYQKSGFLTKSVELWFHRWFTQQGRE